MKSHNGNSVKHNEVFCPHTSLVIKKVYCSPCTWHCCLKLYRIVQYNLCFMVTPIGRSLFPLKVQFWCHDSCPLRLSIHYIWTTIVWPHSFYDQISLKKLLDAWKESSTVPSLITIGRMSDSQDYDLKGHKCQVRSKSPDRHQYWCRWSIWKRHTLTVYCGHSHSIKCMIPKVIDSTSSLHVLLLGSS